MARLFEFLRNDKLNAYTYGALTKAPLRRNQFGGSFGGPIKKDKTFFFGSYSGLAADAERIQEHRRRAHRARTRRRLFGIARQASRSAHQSAVRQQHDSD